MVHCQGGRRDDTLSLLLTYGWGYGSQAGSNSAGLGSIPSIRA